MPIFEFTCPGDHTGLPAKQKIERYYVGQIAKPTPICLDCGCVMKQVEFSVPARRNPEKGIQT